MDGNIGRAAVKAAIVAALLAAVGLVIYAKGQRRTEAAREAGAAIAGEAPGGRAAAAPAPGAALPRLVDLGAGKCIPCKMMAPILEALKRDFAGKMEVVFIDVWERPEEAKAYDIQLIPTQIFYDAAGKERFRHQGFFSREDILAKWKELGVDLGASAPGIVREAPLAKDERPADGKCYMCDGDVQPRTRVTIDSPEGKVHLCSPHCFFILKKWLEKHHLATGKEITIHQALSDKMKLTPEQIKNACKIGECVPPR